MEVDSVHAQIERVDKNKNIYSPASYVTLIEGTKKSKPYYKVKYVDHTYFDDYSCFIILFNKAGCPGILRLLTLCSWNDIQYKLNHGTDDTWRMHGPVLTGTDQYLLRGTGP